MFMTRKITFIFKNKVADMVIILCVERLQAQSSCSKSDFFWLLSWLVHGRPFIQVWQYFFFFQGQCMGPTRADWSRPICFRCCCRGSGILWTEIQGGLSTSKARYRLIHFNLFVLYLSNILSVCREIHGKFEVSAGYTKLTECGQLSYKGYLFTCSSWLQII